MTDSRALISLQKQTWRLVVPSLAEELLDQLLVILERALSKRIKYPEKTGERYGTAADSWGDVDKWSGKGEKGDEGGEWEG